MTGKYSSRNKIKNLKFLRPGLQADLCKTAALPLREEYVHSSQYQKILYQVVKVPGMGDGGRNAQIHLLGIVSPDVQIVV